MKSTFLALAIATAAVNLFAPAVGHAQDYMNSGDAPGRPLNRSHRDQSSPLPGFARNT